MSLVFHLFSINNTEAISANCGFIVFTAELLQYSTESHEIKLLLETKTKKRAICTAATASSLPRAVHTDPWPIIRPPHDFWLLSVRQKCLGLQLTQNIPQGAGTARGWRCLRLVFSVTDCAQGPSRFCPSHHSRTDNQETEKARHAWLGNFRKQEHLWAQRLPAAFCAVEAHEPLLTQEPVWDAFLLCPLAPLNALKARSSLRDEE